MKVSQFLVCLVASQAISAASVPESGNALNRLEQRRVVPAAEILSPDHTLERRKGGGGRGGGSSGGSSSSSSSGGGSSSGGRASSTSNSGGSTSAGSGASRSFGSGRYYGGGASVPYTAGKKTPKGLSPGLLLAPAAVLLIMPGLWLYSVYPYYYTNPYRFYNQSAINNQSTTDGDNNKRSLLWTRQTQGRNETLPVICLCQEYNVCGCDENDDQQYLDDLVGNGSYAALNKTLVTVSDVNGTKTLVLNGTLPNGTTAPGGDSAAPSLRIGNYAGYYAIAMLVVAGVML